VGLPSDQFNVDDALATPRRGLLAAPSTDSHTDVNDLPDLLLRRDFSDLISVGLAVPHRVAKHSLLVEVLEIRQALSLDPPIGCR
jgi:hypothetical protein